MKGRIVPLQGLLTAQHHPHYHPHPSIYWSPPSANDISFYLSSDEANMVHLPLFSSGWAQYYGHEYILPISVQNEEKKYNSSSNKAEIIRSTAGFGCFHDNFYVQWLKSKLYFNYAFWFKLHKSNSVTFVNHSEKSRFLSYKFIYTSGP